MCVKEEKKVPLCLSDPKYCVAYPKGTSIV